MWPTLTWRATILDPWSMCSSSWTWNTFPYIYPNWKTDTVISVTQSEGILPVEFFSVWSFVGPVLEEGVEPERRTHCRDEEATLDTHHPWIEWSNVIGLAAHAALNSASGRHWALLLVYMYMYVKVMKWNDFGEDCKLPALWGCITTFQFPHSSVPVPGWLFP